jgi:hypothetical protein
VQIPMRPSDITPEWLTDTLRTPDTLVAPRITDIQIELLGGTKGTTGPIARLHLTDESDASTAPRSLIAKFSATEPHARALIHGMGFYEREVRFYEHLASRSPLRTPDCYFSAVDLDTGVALLLLPDLEGARNGSSVIGCSMVEAELAVGALAGLHAVWWQHPQLAEMRWLKLRSLVSVQQMPAILQQAWEPFLGKLGADVCDEILQAGEWLKQYLGRLSASLYQEPPYTLVHNDYQADNLFFSGEEQDLSLVVADWQLTTRGRGVLDVAAFLGGNLDPSDRRDHEWRLLHSYHTVLIDNGVRGYSLEQCWDEYRLAMLHPLSRIVTVVGIGAASAEQERGYCEVLVPRLCRAIHDLKVSEVLQRAF